MAGEGTTMVPVTISRVIISREALREGFVPLEEPGSEGTETGHQVRWPATDHLIVLTENGGERALRIGVGPAEALALGMTQSGQEFPRPMTYQFVASLLAGSGTGLREVRITSLTDGVFYAQAVLTNGATIDARPSDAVNLAAITGAPVLVAAELLDLLITELAQLGAVEHRISHMTTFFPDARVSGYEGPDQLHEQCVTAPSRPYGT